MIFTNKIPPCGSNLGLDSKCKWGIVSRALIISLFTQHLISSVSFPSSSTPWSRARSKNSRFLRTRASQRRRDPKLFWFAILPCLRGRRRRRISRGKEQASKQAQQAATWQRRWRRPLSPYGTGHLAVTRRRWPRS